MHACFLRPQGIRILVIWKSHDTATLAIMLIIRNYASYYCLVVKSFIQSCSTKLAKVIYFNDQNVIENKLITVTRSIRDKHERSQLLTIASRHLIKGGTSKCYETEHNISKPNLLTELLSLSRVNGAKLMPCSQFWVKVIYRHTQVRN